MFSLLILCKGQNMFEIELICKLQLVTTVHLKCSQDDYINSHLVQFTTHFFSFATRLVEMALVTLFSFSI